MYRKLNPAELKFSLDLQRVSLATRKPSSMSNMNRTESNTIRPLLSFSMAGRNDNFMGDFTWRLSTTINFIARSAARLNRLKEIEIVVTDWNSDVPLHKVLELVPEAKEITKFISVPKSIAEAAQKDSNYPDSIVANTGIRRASGEFICQTGSDIIFTASTLNAMLNVIEGKYSDIPVKKTNMSGGRRHIPNGIVQRRLPLLEFESYINRNAAYFPEERGAAGHAAPANLMLMHRDLWHQCRGFDERLIYWGFNDIDLTLRITARYGFVQLEHYGVNALHMEHWTKPRDYSPEKMFRKLNPVNNLVPEFAPNSNGWGLGDFEIPLVSIESTVSDITPKSSESDSTWYGPLELLGNEIGKPEVQNSVREILNQFANLPIPETEHPALMTLAWCASVRKPRSFVEVGFRYPHAAALVARHAPGTELIAVVDFERRSEDDYLFYRKDDTSLIFFITNSLRQNNHWAFTQYLRREQLVDGKITVQPLDLKQPVDLVLIRAKDDSAIAVTGDIANQLRIGSAVIISAASPLLYQKVISTIHSSWPQSRLIPFADGVNGLILIAI